MQSCKYSMKSEFGLTNWVYDIILYNYLIKLIHVFTVQVQYNHYILCCKDIQAKDSIELWGTKKLW